MLRPSEVIQNFVYNPSLVVSLNISLENISPSSIVWQNANTTSTSTSTTISTYINYTYYININFKNASTISIPYYSEDDAKNAIKDLLKEINDALFELFNNDEKE